MNAYEEYRGLVGLAGAVADSGHLASLHFVEHHMDVAWRSQPEERTLSKVMIIRVREYNVRGVELTNIFVMICL